MGITRKKLSTWAEEKGVHYRTALSWVRDGLMPLPVERTPGGHIRVIEGEKTTTRTVLYARVSSSDQKADLERQVDRRVRQQSEESPSMSIQARANLGYDLDALVALGRREDAETVGRIVVEHRDRLARFGVEYIEAALVADVVTSMCARIYGQRAAKNRAKRALAAAAEDEP
jgi:putative resolvase